MLTCADTLTRSTASFSKGTQVHIRGISEEGARWREMELDNTEEQIGTKEKVKHNKRQRGKRREENRGQDNNERKEKR